MSYPEHQPPAYNEHDEQLDTFRGFIDTTGRAMAEQHRLLREMEAHASLFRPSVMSAVRLMVEASVDDNLLALNAVYRDIEPTFGLSPRPGQARQEAIAVFTGYNSENSAYEAVVVDPSHVGRKGQVPARIRQLSGSEIELITD